MEKRSAEKCGNYEDGLIKQELQFGYEPNLTGKLWIQFYLLMII